MASINSGWTHSEMQALEKVRLFSGEILLTETTDGGAHPPIELDWGDLARLRLEYPDGEMDRSAVVLSIDYDPHIKGMPIHLYSLEPGALAPEQQWLEQLSGQRFVGESNLVLTYKHQSVPSKVWSFRFRSSPETLRHWNWMRDELQAENDLALDFHGLGRIQGEWQTAVSDDLPCDNERFALLCWAGSQLQNLVEHLMMQPAEMLSDVVEYRPLAMAQSIHATALGHSSAERLAWRPHPDSNRLIPTMVPVRRKRVSVDTTENRFVRTIIRRVIREANNLLHLLQHELWEMHASGLDLKAEWDQYNQYQMERTRSACRTLSAFISTFEGYLSNSFLADVSDQSVHEVSHVLRCHPVYRRIWRVAQELDRGLVACSSCLPLPPAPSLRTRSINSLYEMWVVLTVLRVVEERGFQPQTEELRRLPRSGFNRALQVGAALELFHPCGVELVIRYSYKYPFLQRTESPIGVVPTTVNGKYEAKNQPDLALEFHTVESQVPRLVTVDATYSTHPETLAQKHIYFHTLRSKLWPDQPEEDWDYPVHETWAVYPSIAMTDHRAVQRMHAGELGLLPGERAGERVAVWFDGILTRLGIDLW